MSDQQTSNNKAQSAYLGRLLSVPLISLPMLAIWVVIASVLTPLDVDQREQILQLRWVLIGCGIFVIGVTDAIALVTLLHLSPRD